MCHHRVLAGSPHTMVPATLYRWNQSVVYITLVKPYRRYRPPSHAHGTDLGGCPILCPSFSYCKQTMKMGANGASGRGLQSALKSGVKQFFLEEIMGIGRSEVLNMDPINNNRQFSYEIYCYSIEKSHRTTIRIRYVSYCLVDPAYAPR
jgi:hypothetical protein